jgi:hypothetical protein
MAFW